MKVGAETSIKDDLFDFDDRKILIGYRFLGLGRGPRISKVKHTKVRRQASAKKDTESEMRRKLIAQIKVARPQGVKIAEIAERLGVSRKRVLEIAASAKLKIGSRPVGV
jgi:hypothetical protein